MMMFKKMYFMGGDNVRVEESRFVFDGENYFDIIEATEYNKEEMIENGWYDNEEEAHKAYCDYQNSIEYTE